MIITVESNHTDYWWLLDIYAGYHKDFIQDKPDEFIGSDRARDHAREKLFEDTEIEVVSTGFRVTNVDKFIRMKLYR